MFSLNLGVLHKVSNVIHFNGWINHKLKPYVQNPIKEPNLSVWLNQEHMDAHYYQGHDP